MSAISPSMLQWIGIGSQFASSTTGAIAQWQRGKAEKAAYEFNAAQATEKMKQKEESSRREWTHLMGRQRSLYAKAGVDMSSGSPLLVLADTAMQAAEEQQRISTAGKSEAELDRYYGRMAAYAGTTGAMSTFLSGLGKAAGDIYKIQRGI